MSIELNLLIQLEQFCYKPPTLLTDFFYKNRRYARTISVLSNPISGNERDHDKFVESFKTAKSLFASHYTQNIKAFCENRPVKFRNSDVKMSQNMVNILEC